MLLNKRIAIAKRIMDQLLCISSQQNKEQTTHWTGRDWKLLFTYSFSTPDRYTLAAFTQVTLSKRRL
jgi:hypothetical protein